MFNYTLNTNKQNDALFIMKAGKDYVYGSMPYAKAAQMCRNGNVTRGDNPDYPLAVDGKYFFSGQITEIPEHNETTEEKQDEKNEKPKKNGKK